MWIFRELWDSLCGRSSLRLGGSFSAGSVDGKYAWDDMTCYAQYTLAEDIRQNDECKPTEPT